MMDEHAVRATRKHYDRHACKDVNEVGNSEGAEMYLRYI